MWWGCQTDKQVWALRARGGRGEGVLVGNAKNNVEELLNDVVAIGVDDLVADRDAVSNSEGAEPLDGSLGRREVGTPCLNKEAGSRSRRRADDEVAIEVRVEGCTVSGTSQQNTTY